ncbi:MAG: type II toxin-antitoxin system RelE/ParE family toxin [bacterium]|nr:type II toxin-antitoxin system RelE/ParE family toxin [bacterium]
MRPAKFHPDAEAEMNDAASWYESRQPGLGKRFLTSVQDAVNRVQASPELYPVIEGNVRRCLTKVFPFGVLFLARSDCIIVIAVMHLRREPGYWQSRTPNDPGIGGQ